MRVICIVIQNQQSTIINSKRPLAVSPRLRLDPLPSGTYDIKDEENLSRIVATAFMQRRKTIRNSLRDIASLEDLAAAGIDPGQRPEQLGIDKFVRLSNHLSTGLR